MGFQLSNRLLISAAVFATGVGCGRQASQPQVSSAKAASSAQEYFGRVATCHDGDTCVIKLTSGSTMKVRFIGIDAPEVSGGDDNQGQPLGKAARVHLNSLIKDKDVRVRALSTDMYDRTLGEIYLGDTLINVEMIRKGFAEAYIWSNSNIDAHAYKAAEQSAKAADRGIWGLENYERPEHFRQRTQSGE